MPNTISYWNETGKYQLDNDRLWKEHVPVSGEATTIEGELIRAVGRLYHEYCNNGNCNAAHREDIEEWTDCITCGGSGVVEYDEENEDGIHDEVDCSNCEGEGGENEEDQGDPEITDMYCDFITLIETHVKCIEATDALRKLIVDPCLHYAYKYTQEEYDIYNAVTDQVIEYVLEKEKTGFTKR